MKQVESSEIRQLRKIQEEIIGGAKNTVAKCIKAGELLAKIKATTKYGDWGTVLQSVQISRNTADRYMHLWDRRTVIDLKAIRTLADAVNLITDVPVTSSRFDEPTSQNEPLTHEKTSKSKGVKPTENASQNSDRKPITGDTDNSQFYMSSPVPAFHVERDKVDPADRIPQSTAEDVSAALEVSEVYPKKVTTLLLTRDEEDSYGVWYQGIVVKRGTNKPKVKIDMGAAIRSVCSAYKKTTGKGVSVKPSDAGQLRRLLESGITLEEFIEVGQKAWKSNGFFARQSHRLISFVKHYENIRNEIENPENATNQRPSRPGADRNAGTANSTTIGQYDGIGKVV